MGTPQFAVPSLVALCERYPVVGVVTQPDRPAGRGRTVTPSPVKSAALARGIAVYQPRSLRAAEAMDPLAEWQPEVIVVAAFGQILPPAVLTLPAHGCLNVHASLLPRYRGAAPIPAAILAGDTVTGVTLMRMDEGMDTGPILAQAECAISPEDTTGSLYFNKLFPLGVEAIVEAVQMVRDGTAPRITQDESRATNEPLCTEDRTLIDWEQPIDRVYNLIRGANPQPGAGTTFRGQRLKIFDCRKQSYASTGLEEGPPGEVIAVNAEGFWVAATGGQLLVQRVQPENNPKVKAVKIQIR